MKKVKKIVLIVIAVIVLIPALAFLGICAQSYYMNMNPDHVDLKKDGWVKVISFTTVWKKIPVEIYGRPGKEVNSGEFVVVRKGVLPFGINSMTEIYACSNVWKTNNANCRNTNDSLIIPGKVYFFDVVLGHGIYNRHTSFYEPSPSVSFSFAKWCSDSSYRQGPIYYQFLDNVPIIQRFRKNIYDWPKVFNLTDTYKNSININQNIALSLPIIKEAK